MTQAGISDKGHTGGSDGVIILDHNDNSLSVTTGENDDSEYLSLNGLVVNSTSVVTFIPAYWGGYPDLYINRLEIYNDSILIIKSAGIGHFSFGQVGDFLSVEDVKRRVAIDTGDGVLKQAVWHGHYLTGWSGAWMPVPEPTCYAVLFGGLGLGAFAWRREKSRSGCPTE